MSQRSLLQLFLIASAITLTCATAQPPQPGNQEQGHQDQCGPAIFCAKGIGPDAPDVCVTDKTHMVCSVPSEEVQREMREMLRRRAEELRADGLEQQPDR